MDAIVCLKNIFDNPWNVVILKYFWSCNIFFEKLIIVLELIAVQRWKITFGRDTVFPHQREFADFSIFTYSTLSDILKKNVIKKINWNLKYIGENYNETELDDNIYHYFYFENINQVLHRTQKDNK